MTLTADILVDRTRLPDGIRAGLSDMNGVRSFLASRGITLREGSHAEAFGGHAEKASEAA